MLAVARTDCVVVIAGIVSRVSRQEEAGQRVLALSVSAAATQPGTESSLDSLTSSLAFPDEGGKGPEKFKLHVMLLIHGRFRDERCETSDRDGNVSMGSNSMVTDTNRYFTPFISKMPTFIVNATCLAKRKVRFSLSILEHKFR